MELTEKVHFRVLWCVGFCFQSNELPVLFQRIEQGLDTTFLILWIWRFCENFAVQPGETCSDSECDGLNVKWNGQKRWGWEVKKELGSILNYSCFLCTVSVFEINLTPKLLHCLVFFRKDIRTTACSMRYMEKTWIPAQKQKSPLQLPIRRLHSILSLKGLRGLHPFQPAQVIVVWHFLCLVM